MDKEENELPQDKIELDFQNSMKNNRKSGKSQNILKKKVESEKKGSKVRCNLCHKTFSKNYNINTHIKRVHNNLDEFSCDSCGKIFKFEINLKEHTKSVHENKKEKCAFC